MTDIAAVWRGASPERPAMLALDARTGLLLRRATPAEVTAWETGNEGRHRAFWTDIRVGPVVVTESTGPGAWYGGAGF